MNVRDESCVYLWAIYVYSLHFYWCCKHLCLLPFIGLRPRRTLRTVLWTAEEQGGVGAQQYFNLHKVLLQSVTEAVARKPTV